MATSTKTKQKQFVNQSTVESLRELGDDVVQSVAQDVLGAGVKDFWKQVLMAGNEGQTHEQNGGELSEGQELDLSKRSLKESSDIAPAIDYRREILDGAKYIGQKEHYEIKAKIQEIIVELKRIASSSKELQITFKEVVIEQRIQKPGKYHINFFDWVLTMLQIARMRIEDSGAWLATMKSKKGQKQYWNQFKQHGTSFGLSNERVVATQTG